MIVEPGGRSSGSNNPVSFVGQDECVSHRLSRQVEGSQDSAIQKGPPCPRGLPAHSFYPGVDSKVITSEMPSLTT